MQRLTLLEYKNYRYLKPAAGLVALAVLAYLFHSPVLGPRGDTWLGYTLAVIGAAAVFILAWYGVVRRRIPVLAERRKMTPLTLLQEKNFQERRMNRVRFLRRRASTLQGWLSAHIYLGLATFVIVTLHSGFHFGWNIHTLTYALLIGVIVTGLYGVYAYLRFPRLMTDNLGGDSMSTLLADISELDQLARTNALRLPDEFDAIVQRSSRDTRITGGLLEQLRGRPRLCATRVGIDQLQQLNVALDPAQIQVFRDICSLLLRKESQLKRVRLELMYKSRLQIWLHVHVPLAIGLIAALFAHVTAVFFFW